MADAVIVTDNGTTPETTDNAVEELAEVAETAIEAATIATVVASTEPDKAAEDAATILSAAMAGAISRLENVCAKLESAADRANTAAETTLEVAEIVETMAEAEAAEDEVMVIDTEQPEPDVPPSNFRNRFRGKWSGK